jgi:2-dehydropantoate 2-reductase
MKISVIGIGAMGSIYAGLFHESGHEVWGIDIWKEHVQAISQHGLKLEGASGDRVIYLKATTNPAEVGECDLVIIATKALHVARATEMAKSLIGINTLILTIQNGIGSSESITQKFGVNRLVLGVAGGFGASVKAAGHVHHNGMNLIQIGEIQGSITPRLKRLTKIWTDAGFNAESCEDIEKMIWEKLICNVCYSGICTITKLNIGQIMESSTLWPVATSCSVEAWKVAQAKLIDLSFPDPIPHVRAFGSKIPNARPSMLLDHVNGRASEIEAINGAIVREGKLLGVDTPYNAVITALVAHQEQAAGLR